MGDISRTLGAAGAGFTIKVGEKVWTICPPTKRIQSAFEDFVQRKERRNIADFKGVVSDAEHGKMAERFGKRLRKGLYNFGSRYCMEAIATYDGVVEMLRLMLEPNHPGVTADDATGIFNQAPEELKLVLSQAVGKSGADDSKKNGTVTDPASASPK